MAFSPVTMTLRVTSAGSTVANVEVKRPGPEPFVLHVPSFPVPAVPGAALPKSPAQPFTCVRSTTDSATGGQRADLCFDNSALAIAAWSSTFAARRTLLLQMDILGRLGERLTVNLLRIEEAKSAVWLAATKVVQASGALVVAILGLLRAITLSAFGFLTRSRREPDAELSPANGPKDLG
jgi:hypothetical protein